MIVRRNIHSNQVTFHDSLGHQIGPTMGYSRFATFIADCLEKHIEQINQKIEENEEVKQP